MSGNVSGSRKGGYTRKLKPANTTNGKIINPNRTLPKNAAHMRDAATIRRLKMYKMAPIRSKDGKFLGGAFMSRTPDERVKRVQPDRRWFGNTRVVQQKDLQVFRDEMKAKVADPYQFVLQSRKLPMALVSDTFEHAKMNLLTAESFEDTFGPGAQRKRPKLEAGDIQQLASAASRRAEKVEEEIDERAVADEPEAEHYQGHRAKIFDKGGSRRIWSELYKVIDSSDVLIQVLDARNPLGSRSRRIEQELKKPERRHKSMILILNKCDLVPTWVTRRWVKILSREYPTLAFHASTSRPFGKGALIQLLRQFGFLHKDRRQISVGFVGYPNVGKSSIINTLRGENVCPAAPVPGETKVWRYVTLFKRIFLIDCPGVVYSTADSETDAVLKGVVRVEMLDDPAAYVAGVLERVKPQYVAATYGVRSWTDPVDFLDQLCRKTGKLLKGGEPDYNNVSRRLLHDFQRGRIPYYEEPPFEEREGGEEAAGGGDGPQVEQLFNKISVKVSFDPSEEPEESRRQIKAENRARKERDRLARARAQVVDWDEVYADVNPDDEEVIGEAASSSSSSSSSSAAASAAAAAAPKKGLARFDGDTREERKRKRGGGARGQVASFTPAGDRGVDKTKRKRKKRGDNRFSKRVCK